MTGEVAWKSPFVVIIEMVAVQVVMMDGLPVVVTVVTVIKLWPTSE